MLSFADFQMRVSLPRTVLAVSITTVLIILYIIVQKFGKKQFTQTCNHSLKFHEGLHNLAERYGKFQVPVCNL